MALLWRLLLAHFLTDFTFQSEWFFRQKNKYLSRIFHGAFAGLLSLLIVLPYMEVKGRVNIPLLLLVIAIGVSHILIDVFKLYLSLQKDRETFSLFIADQTLHLLIIYLGVSLLPPQMYQESAIEFKLLTFIVFTLWATPIIVRIIESEFKKKRLPVYEYYKEDLRGLSLWERGCLFLGVGLMGYYLILLPLAVLPRLIWKLNYHKTKLPVKNWLLALGFGIVYLISTKGVGG